jgi:RHS repeat-associated protein
MVLGSRGPRSGKIRLTAGLALSSMFLGSLRMAQGAPPLPEKPPSPVVGTRQARAVPAGKLASDSAWTIPTRLIPAKITLLDGSSKAEAVRALFDQRATTGLATGGSPARFRVDLAAPSYIDALATYGRTDGVLSVDTDGPKGQANILSYVSLSKDSGGWNRHEIADGPLASSVTVTFKSGRADAALREMEIWGRPASAPATEAALLPDALYTSVPAGTFEMPATPVEQTIALSTVSGPTAGGTFTLKVDADPRGLERTFLVYELEGLPHFTAALRSINGQRALGRFGVSRGAKGGIQVEEIDPSSLQAGTNRIQFLPIDEHDPGSYRVKNLRVVGVLPGATRLSDASARLWEALRDGREGTGWKSDPHKPTQKREWTFTGATQPWALDLRLPARATGTLAIGSIDANSGSKGTVSVRLDDLSPGWHRVPLGHLPTATKLAFELSAGKELGAAISELAVEGSALPADEAPRLAITYPLSGECVNHRVHVRGFVTPADAEEIYANGTRIDGAIRGDGAFALELGEREAAGRNVVLEAAYAGGLRARQTVAIGRCVERPPVVLAPDGRPRQPVDDLGAPFGVTVKAGEAATLDFDGVKVDIPEGAVEKDVRVTIRPLPTKDIAPLDSGMQNVSPEAQAFRFGPLGMMFKKPVKMTLPYDAKLIPTGYSERDVRTFYYDEGAHRWEQVALLSQGERDMVAVSNHFTDFINATMPMPEHPGTQSENPTALKDLKLADPAAGITEIEPPGSNSDGAARLRYPIEVPPGRRGVQPSLALTYDSERTNTSGWVGVGWDLSLSSIEVDTRFGVPRYDSSETYLLDGDALVPISGKPGFYQRRVEGRFDQIQRLGTDPTSYSWVVTDKTGTRFTYGANANGANSTLADARPGQPGNIFKWGLERMQDATGNFMTISYFPDTYVNGDTFTQIYPQKIQYTGNGGFSPPYEVDLVLDNGTTRPDIVMTGRPGFPVSTRRRLTAINVSLSGTPIRSYQLQYLGPDQFANTFNKSVLSSVSLIGADNSTQFYQHTFDYFPAPAADAMFATPQPWGTLSNTDGSTRGDDGLSHAQDQLFGGSGSIGIGFLNFFSASISAGGDSGSTIPNLEFVDGNGDGLPDQLNSASAANLNQLAGANPSAHFGEISFPGLGSLGHTNRSGWTVSGGISALDGLFGANAGYSQHTAEDDQVLIDMNGDGFPDIVSNNGGAVTVNLNNGSPQTFGPAQPWNGYSLSGVSFTRQDRFSAAAQGGAFFPADPLIRWVAPFPGTVAVNETFQKLKAGGDGVRVDVFFNNESTPRATCAFGPNDLAPCPQMLNLTVIAGDRLYTKTTSLTDPTFDDLSASMVVSYTTDPSVASQVEPYGAPIYTFNQKNDFRMAGRPSLPWSASAKGTVSVQPCFTKASTPDNLRVSVIQNDSLKNGGGILQRIDFSAAATDTGTFCIPQLQQPLSVDIDQTLAFQVTSDAQIDPASVSWPVTVTYSNYCRIDPSTQNPVCAAPVCASGQCTIGPSDPLASFPIPQGLVQAMGDVFYPAFVWTSATPSPTASYVVPVSGTTPITWNVSAGSNRLVVLVQGVNKLLAKQILDPSNPTASISISPSLQAGEQIFFTVLSTDGSPVLPFAVGAPVISGAQVANVVNLLFPDPRLDNNNGTTQARDPMSDGYHRWWYGDWNGSQAFDESKIVVTANPQNSNSFLFSPPAPFGSTTRPDLGAIPLWLGRGSGEYMAAGQVNPALSASGATTGNGAGVQSLRVADTWNFDLSANATVIEAGVNAGDSTTDIDLIDLNGDRYPDSVTAGGVQYNDGVGAFSQRMPIDMSFPQSESPAGGDVRSTVNASLRLGLGFNFIGQLINLANSGSKTKEEVSTDVASASTDYGVSSTRVDFIDMNGDGLPDRVAQRPGDPGVRVRLNLGYGFSQEILWNSNPWQEGEIPASILSFAPNSAPVTYGTPLIEGAMSAIGGLAGNDVTSTDALRFSDTQTNNLSVGVPGSVFGAGGGPSATLNRTIVDFIDINGDGLPDQVMRAPNDSDPTLFHVKLNRGDHFDVETPWSIPSWEVSTALPSIDLLANPDGVSYSTMAGWSASVNFQFCFFVCIGGSAFYSRSNGGLNMGFEDIDGDGRPDQVLKVEGDGNVYAKLNQAGKTNLLKTVHRPLGSTINLDYERVGNFVQLTTTPQVDMPNNQYALASVTIDDGRSNSYTNSFDYSELAPGGGLEPFGSRFYDRGEREELGYGRVHMVRSAVDFQGDSIGDGSQVDTFYFNQDYYRRGLPQLDVESDASNRLIKGSSVTYAAPPATPQPPMAPDRTVSFFPAESQRRTLFFEKAGGFSVPALAATVQAGNTPAAPKVKLETRTFDGQGNLTDLVDAGDEQTSADDVEYKISYATDPTGAYIIKPTEIDAFPAGNPSALLRKRLVTYNPGTGTTATLTNIVSGGKVPGSGTPGTVYNQASAINTYTYDAFGNLLTSVDPTGYTLQYTYDPTAQTYRTRVDDKSFGYFSTATYDLRFGTLQQSNDVNGQPVTSTRDIFGRVCSVRGPDDQATSDATITMTYGVVPSSCPNGPAPGTAFPAYAVTRHKDVQHSGDPIDTVTFIDGLGRTIQTKKDADVDESGNGTVSTGMAVSGLTTFDGRGRVARQAQPNFLNTPTTTFVAVPNTANATTYQYDEIDRQLNETVPDGAGGIITSTAYTISTNGLGDDRTWLQTTVTDPDGNEHLSYADSRGNRVGVQEFNTIGTATALSTLTTTYGYDPLDQLLSVTDANGNVTTSAYDTVGRTVTLTSPDSGQLESRFDLAGNMKEKQTPVLRAARQTIQYNYNFDRLQGITYPTSPPVTYTYGASTETGDAHGNVAGRIKQVVFDNGSEARSYDHLGNVIQTQTTLNRMSTTTGLPASITFPMQYTYDWLGRMQTMTFPNWIDQSYKILAGPGELITYKYNHGGNIDNITGFDQTPNPQQTSTPRNYNYLNHIGYNEFEQRTVLVNGNGIFNNYGYDAPTRRLVSINASANGSLEQQQKLGPVPFHNLHYTYDKVGNITEMINNVSVQPGLNAGVFVGPLDVKYTYDDLYQLRSMTAKYRGNVAYGYQYSNAYTYDAIGNMQTKAQSQDRLVWNNQTVNTKDTNPVVDQLAGSTFDHNVTGLTFSLGYQYTSGRPHAAAPVTETLPNVSPASRTYTYDANGNNTGNTFQQNKRAQVWNEENRLNEVDLNGGFLAKFKYNDQGERTKKQTSGGDAWYVNQYFVLLPNNLPTKHIYAGDTRVATKTDAIYMQTPVLDYYHNDHLGTTSYLTIQTQDLVQHERYFAFGGLWRPGDEQDETDLPRGQLERNWTFLGKEWDVDESLYYFGARYFDPHADAWQSTDPALPGYMHGVGNAGVFSPQNLGLYTYSWNNPIILRDPDGLMPGGAGMGAGGSTRRTGVGHFDPVAIAGAFFAPVVGFLVSLATDNPRIGAGVFVGMAAFGENTANAPTPTSKPVPSRTTTDIALETGGAAAAAVAGPALGTALKGTEVAVKAGEQAVVKEGIYEFTAASGKTYVGQSGDIAARIDQHLASGKLLPSDLPSVKTTEVLGGKTAREVAEQVRINQLGGVKNLENIRNPIGPARQHLLPKVAPTK